MNLYIFVSKLAHRRHPPERGTFGPKAQPLFRQTLFGAGSLGSLRSPLVGLADGLSCPRMGSSPGVSGQPSPAPKELASRQRAALAASEPHPRCASAPLGCLRGELLEASGCLGGPALARARAKAVPKCSLAPVNSEPAKGAARCARPNIPPKTIASGQPSVTIAH